MDRLFILAIRVAFCVLLTAGQCLLTACSDGATPTSPTTAAPTSDAGGGGTGGTGPGAGTQTPTIAGSYRLATVNGLAVPAVFDSVDLGGGARMEMRAVRGEITVNADGTYLQEVETQLRGTMLPADRVDVVQTVGTWTLVGSTLTFTPFQRPPFTPGYSDGSIQIVTSAPNLRGGLDTVRWVFRR